MIDDPDSDEDFLIDEDDGPVPQCAARAAWKLLVVDDEPDVFAITKIVLADFSFAGAALEIIPAYSRSEAEAYLQQHDDVAVLLLDVVMEETDAGLRLVEFVRVTLGNKLVRIVLRTGQPGYAPEKEVILRYDINDYKEKTELTTQKLFTTVVASLRAYQHLLDLERQRAGLAQIVHANQGLARHQELDEFGKGALAFMVALLNAGGGELRRREGQGSTALARQGDLPESAIDAIDAWDGLTLRWVDGLVLAPIPSRTDSPVFVCLGGVSSMDDGDRVLFGILAEAVGAGWDSVLLLGRLQDAQKAIVYALARMAEFRDAGTGEHVRRVERMVRAMALKLRVHDDYACLRDEAFVEQLVLASVLHDVGKVGVPDAILNKPGALDGGEKRQMQAHVAIGAEILAEAAGMVPGMNYIALAAEIAANHHESADGSGYPGRKTLDQIPVSARIVSVADVYDALVSKRPYKEGWPREKAIAWLREMAGQRFDPRAVEALAAVIGESSFPTEGQHRSEAVNC